MKGNKKKNMQHQFAIIVTLATIVFVALVAAIAALQFQTNQVKQSAPQIVRPARVSSTPAPAVKKSESPAPQTNSSKAGSPLPTYSPSICTKTTIPHKTVYHDAAWLYVGDNRVDIQGRDGYKETCTADSNGVKPSDYTLDPLDTSILVGTRQQSTSPPAPARTYDDAYNYCVGRVPGNSSAWDQCISAYLSQ